MKADAPFLTFEILVQKKLQMVDLDNSFTVVRGWAGLGRAGFGWGGVGYVSQ